MRGRIYACLIFMGFQGYTKSLPFQQLLDDLIPILTY